MRPLKRTMPALLVASTALAHAAGVPTLLEPVVVTGDASAPSSGLIGVADSATEGTVTARQLANRPLLRPAEVMEAVPGMTVTQHSGDGKANQYFLRGFNLDHGSDFATSVMGMPVNMVTHGHGQGYMDLNFLIPELIGNLRYRKGVYAAEDGDFATTGSARIDYKRSLKAPFAEVTLGAHGYSRSLLAGSRPVGDMTLLGAFEFDTNDGPWDQPEGLRKHNAVLRLSSGTAQQGHSLTLLAYHADWKATEHVPERAILSGEIGRFGALSPDDGGETHRYSLNGEWASADDQGRTHANAYVVDYGLNLFSNPSGFINGPQGDQHEQVDQRVTWGGHLARTWHLSPTWFSTEATLGLQLRQDRIGRVGLYDTVGRQRTNTVLDDRVQQTSVGVYAEAKTQWTDWFRSIVGLRQDELRARVTPLGGASSTNNGGRAQGHQLSPKLGLVLGPFDQTEFYANWGQGFHSNDARGMTRVLDKVPPLAKATGAELGLRTAPLPGWNSSLALWQMDLASELVFIGDEGVTEPKGGSHRMGLEWSNYYTFNRWLILDADLAWSRARFVDPNASGGKYVPNAIPVSASLALTADNQGAWFGGLRLRYVGAYALEETGEQKSSPFWTTNLKAGYRFTPQLQIALDILNVFDRRANDIEYWGAACSRNDGPGCNGGDGIDGRLVHPMEPRTFRVAMRASF
ncbi:MAG: TonB-dependent receptor [Rubrivivax sp.]|nr:MAG: TonB-dependent receptor [Rubrivivax sp.]